jgi:hypothetical protein
LTEFTQKPKFKELKNRLKQAIFRISVEKYKKEVSSSQPLSPEHRTEFKANLYILTQQVMQYALRKAIKHGRKST